MPSGQCLPSPQHCGPGSDLKVCFHLCNLDHSPAAGDECAQGSTAGPARPVSISAYVGKWLMCEILSSKFLSPTQIECPSLEKVGILCTLQTIPGQLETTDLSLLTPPLDPQILPYLQSFSHYKNFPRTLRGDKVSSGKRGELRGPMPG